MTLSRRLTLGLLAPLLAAGCGGPAWPPTAPVSGTITSGGRPLPGVNVGFQAADAPRSGYGTTDSAGRYTLTTFMPGDGAIVGDHVVVVAPGSPATADDLSLDMTDPKEYEAYMRAVKAADKPPRDPAVPARYGSPATTPLKATVKPGPNVLDFDLSDG